MTDPASPRPNVIWIFGDQHRAQCMGQAGDPNVHTPCLDRLASEGMTVGGVAGFPLCCPARGSLLTGRYPHHVIPGHELPMPKGQPTLAQPFSEEGYHTAWFGKWHVDGYLEREGRPVFYTVARDRRGGFDAWLGYENNNSQYDCFVHGHDASGEEIPHRRLDGYETDELTTLFIDHLRQHASKPGHKPFFAALSVQPPHDPYVAPESFMSRHTPGVMKMRPNVPDVARVMRQARSEYAGYCGMVENLDHNVGRIRQVLMELGIDRHTHVIFFSDHGDMLGSHGQFRKTTPHEESIRVPMILGGGAGRYDFRPGDRPDVLINNVDLAPTSLGLCGITPPDWMQGFDYSSLRHLGQQPTKELPDSAYLQCIIPTMHANSIDRPWRGLVTRDHWKYVCLEGQPWLMFNLNEDPYEQVNLAFNTQFAEKRKQLHDRLRAWVSDTGDQFNLPEI